MNKNKNEPSDEHGLSFMNIRTYACIMIYKHRGEIGDGEVHSMGDIPMTKVHAR
jgi:hypothetical protein